MRQISIHLAAALAFVSVAGAQTTTALIPDIQRIVDGVSEERIAASMKKLEAFGTRHIMSEQDNPTHGIGAAQNWLVSEFKSYSPRLQVSLDKFVAKKGARISKDVDLANVVAVLPGKVDPTRYVIISAHYDTIARAGSSALPRTDGGARTDGGEGPANPQDVSPLAPGVVDDGSGVAAVLELARVMSAYDFDKSVVFIAFSAEEVGLVGSAAWAAHAKEQKLDIEAVLNNDIIGSDISGNGRSANGHVHIFAEGPEDSGSRALARFTKEIGERYLPAMSVDLVLRRDRFSRGGDHTSLNKEGYTAVRVTTASENYANQHSVTDTFANASVPYTTRVAKINAAALATLAQAPRPPVLTRPRGAGGPAPSANAARPAGPGLTRGKSGYDAALRWIAPEHSPDIAGYAVVIRPTTSAFWEREIYVGNVTEYTIPDLSIDDVVIGVKAIDKDGHQSLVASYDLPAANFTGAPAGAPSGTAPATTPK